MSVDESLKFAMQLFTFYWIVRIVIVTAINIIANRKMH